MVQERAHTRTLAPSLYRGEGSRLGTSLLTPDCSTGCKTTFLLLCGLAWKTLPLQSATLCCLKGCCFALGEPSSGTGRDLWCSARRSCLPVLSSLVLKKQNMHQQNRVLCLGLWLQFLLHLRVMPDVSVGWVLLVNWYYFYSKNRAGSLGRQWARHEGWFRFGLLLVGLGWGFFFSLSYLQLTMMMSFFCLWPKNRIAQMSLLHVSLGCLRTATHWSKTYPGDQGTQVKHPALPQASCVALGK